MNRPISPTQYQIGLKAKQTNRQVHNPVIPKHMVHTTHCEQFMENILQFYLGRLKIKKQAKTQKATVNQYNPEAAILILDTVECKV